MSYRRRALVVLTTVAVLAAVVAPAVAASGGPVVLTGAVPADVAPADVVPADVAPAGAAAGSTTPAARYLVGLADPLAAGRVTSALRGGPGRVVAVYTGVGTAVVEVTPDVAARLAALAGVLSVTPDGAAHLQSLGYDPAGQAGSMTNVTRLTGARDAWRQGVTGAGVDVAVIDTGTTPVPALRDSAKVVVGPDLSFDSQAVNLRHLDGYGHGTHMASIIGGRETPEATGTAYAAETANLYGMAPDARIVSVKVGDHEGVADVSQLIAAIDWVVQNRRTGGLNIRVLNLSFGTDSRQSYVVDPLAHAAEAAWTSGIFVVASAGNDGSTTLGLADPAYHPGVFAVGAVDTRGTDDRADDVVPAFSQHTISAGWFRGPDLVAPGVGIVAAGVRGGALWNDHPAARVGTDGFRGSGTSQAAAVVSGAAALVLQRRPDASPDVVKDLLTRTATPLASSTAEFQGRGELDVTAALAAPAAKVAPARTRSLGTGRLEAARGSAHVVMDGVTLTGERDIMGARWDAWIVAPRTHANRMWLPDGGFNGRQWIGAGFTADTTTAAGRAWGGRSWADRSWAGRSWAGATWSGRSWAGASWNGRAWAGAWSAAAWSATGTPTRTGPTLTTGTVPRYWSTAAWR